MDVLASQVLSGKERALLLRIARCSLIDIAARDTGHPCHQVVAVQRPEGDMRQVPEGWAGNLREARVAFLSSNPAISEPAPGQPEGTVEAYPSAACSDEHIAGYLGRRFDQTVLPRPVVSGFRPLQADGLYAARPTAFWGQMHRRAMELLGPAADPARNYVMTEVVHCKSVMGEGVAAAAATCAGLYLDAVFRLAAAPVVVVVGMQAHVLLKSRFAALPDPPYIHREDLGGKERALVFLWPPAAFIKGPKTLAGLYGPQCLERLRALAASESTA